MHRPNRQGDNPLSQAQFGNNDAMFRPPGMRPNRFQSSPRFHQQFVPHFSGPGRGDNNFNGGPGSSSPRHNSPFVSPPHSGSYESPNIYRSGGMYHSTPDSGHSGRGGRGRYIHHRHDRGNNRNSNSPRFSLKHEMNSPSGMDSDFNPGQCDDIRQYYSPDMVKDPWAHLKHPATPNPQTQ